MLAQNRFRVLLIERDSLGAAQTVASQGILHGGIKYTLSGAATAAAKAVADMPARWHAAMSNAPGADLDLRAVHTLCPAQYLWTTGSLFSRITAKVAATAIRTAVRRIDPAQACEGLRRASGVDIHQVDEPVIEPRSLVKALYDRFIAAGGVAIKGEPRLSTASNLRELSIGGVTVSFSTVVFAAGSGNEQLLAQLAPSAAAPSMQRRPLHMVFARSAPGARLPELYGHCIAALSDKPRITVTTQTDTDGRITWYIGGNIAETGVDRSPAQQIAAAKQEVADCLPWLNLEGTQWSTLRIDRAEGLTPDGHRPDHPVIAPVQGSESIALAVWPTKLVFAPLVGDKVIEWVKLHTAPSTPQAGSSGHESLAAQLPTPPIAPLPWNREDLQWS